MRWFEDDIYIDGVPYPGDTDISAILDGSGSGCIYQLEEGDGSYTCTHLDHYVYDVEEWCYCKDFEPEE